MLIKFECPYCKHKEEVSVNQHYGITTGIETCGNCDLRYVLETEGKVTVKTLKIEGEEE